MALEFVTVKSLLEEVLLEKMVIPPFISFVTTNRQSIICNDRRDIVLPKIGSAMSSLLEVVGWCSEFVQL